MKKFVLFSCLLLALTITACARDATKPTKEASSKTAQTSAKPKSEDPFDKLTASFLKMGKVKSFRAKTTTWGGVRTITTEFEAPDRFHFISAPISDAEVFVIEGTEYFKVSPTEWRKGKAKVHPNGHTDARVQASVDAKKLKADLDVASMKESFGSKVLDGEPTLVFEYEVPKYDGKKLSSIWTHKIWIGVSDSLPRKLDISARTADGSVGPGGYGSDTNYYDYNANIEIEPPIE